MWLELFMSKEFYVLEILVMLFFKKYKIVYFSYFYEYEEYGGIVVLVCEFNVFEYSVVKMLVMEDEYVKFLLVLMYGDCKVLIKELVCQVGVKKIVLCVFDMVNCYMGFLVGGILFFGIKNVLLVFMEKSIFDLLLIYINGGKCGYFVGVYLYDIVLVLQVKLVVVVLFD